MNMNSTEHIELLGGGESTTMDQVMAHLGDDDLFKHLVRYNNSQAREKLRELVLYSQMLLARMESTDRQNVKRIHPEEVDIICQVSESIQAHLRNAELFTREIAEEQRRRFTQETITSMETAGYGVGAANAINNGGSKRVTPK